MAKKQTTDKSPATKSKPKKSSTLQRAKEVHEATPQSAADYVVLARRYRPQQLGEVIGQEAVAEALTGAIEAGRVAHAYLFTGSRGVGKTSMARILAKALNCAEGPTAHPCDRCEICRAIISGDDVDVLEIDGASNRGIDEIRELRQNVGFRPSRTRYKVYIIDEVHMLTREAFNALLKTLEEPPPHVKFIFCTTEAHKIPITILSRCQRFDFGTVPDAAILGRLQQVVASEHVEADAEALEAIARRAAGSMRDSQSLLDQVLAFGGKKITAEQVHRLLGTATEELVTDLGNHLLSGRPGEALSALQSAVAGGVQVEQLLDQLIDFFRDLMVVRCPGEGPPLHSISAAAQEQFAQLSQARPLGNILAGLQVLIDAKTRMRGSSYGQTLAELALVRVATLENLDEMANLIGDLRQTAAPAPSAPSAPSDSTRSLPRASGAAARNWADAQKKTLELSARRDARPTAPADNEAASASAEPGVEIAGTNAGERELDSSAPLGAGELPDLWREALARCDDLMLREQASRADQFTLGEANQLVAFFSEEYTFSKNYCARPEFAASLEAALASVAGRPVKLRFETRQSDGPAVPVAPSLSQYKRRVAESAEEPLVRKVQELFQATIVRVDDVPAAAE